MLPDSRIPLRAPPAATRTCAHAAADTPGSRVETLCVRVALHDEHRRTQRRSHRFRILDKDTTETLADKSRLHKQRLQLHCLSALKSQRVEANDGSSALEDEEAHVLGPQLFLSIGQLRTARLNELRRVPPMRLGPQGQLAQKSSLARSSCSNSVCDSDHLHAA